MTFRRAALVVALATSSLNGCSDQGAGLADQEERDIARPSLVAASPMRLGKARERTEQIAARQAQAAGDEQYWISAAGPLVSAPLRAHNQGLGAQLTFAEHGAEISPTQGKWRLAMRATGFVCGSQTLDLSPSLAVLGEAPNRVEYRGFAGAAPFSEWYVNGPLGLEQGFTLQEPPCATGITKLGIEIALQGLSARLDDVSATPRKSRPGVSLLDPQGLVVAHYSDWFAADAIGRSLPIAVHVTDQGVRLEVDLSGARFPVVVDPLIWTEQGWLYAYDWAEGDNLGYAVALSGDAALLGSPNEGSVGFNGGAAYIFTRSSTGWSDQQKLTASDGFAADQFGSAVDISGDTAIVGAWWKANRIGAAYVFSRSGKLWSQQQKLTASGGLGDDIFGEAVAVDGDTALVGAPGDDAFRGSAFVFVRSGVSWTLQSKLLAGDRTVGDQFGWSVSLSGDTALLGAYASNGNQGAAYVFTRSNGVWTQQQKLAASDAASDDYFGLKVSLSGESALIGACYTNDKGPDSGSAYVFTRSGAVWTQQQKLTASDGLAGDFLGFSLEIADDVALLGAPQDDVGAALNVGSAYVFRRVNGVWAQEQQLFTKYGINDDLFGHGVSLSGETALIGVPNESSAAGAAYPFQLGTGNGEACVLNGDCASLNCVEGVCCDGTCSEVCRSCLAARKTAGPNGECGDVAPGTDPRDSCADDGASSCLQNGLCGESAKCANYAVGDECSDAACPTPTSQDPPDSCSVLGVCSVTAGSACLKGYGCVAGACQTSCATDQDCDLAGGHVCLEQACRLPAGTTCIDPADCATGFCADGVCCVAACEGQCESCSEPKHVGECLVVEGEPRGDRKACTDLGEAACAASCDGEHADECQFVPATVGCGASCEKDQVVLSTCDGQGRCEARSPKKCAPYVCGEDTCLSDCVTGRDCASGYQCAAGQCVPAETASTCSPELDLYVPNTGAPIACAPFLCDPTTGACRVTCDASDQCAADTVCNPTTRACEQPEATPSQVSGCGCRSVGGTDSGALPVSILLGLGAWLLQARRRRRGSFWPA